MQVKAQADTSDSTEAKEHAKSELESLKACTSTCSMNSALTGSLSKQLHLLRLAVLLHHRLSFEKCPHPIRMYAAHRPWSPTASIELAESLMLGAGHLVQVQCV